MVARQPLYDNYPNIAKEVRTQHKRAPSNTRRHEDGGRQILMTSHATTCVLGVALASEPNLTPSD